MHTCFVHVHICIQYLPPLDHGRTRVVRTSYSEYSTVQSWRTSFPFSLCLKQEWGPIHVHICHMTCSTCWEVLKREQTSLDDGAYYLAVPGNVRYSIRITVQNMVDGCALKCDVGAFNCNFNRKRDSILRSSEFFSEVDINMRWDSNWLAFIGVTSAPETCFGSAACFWCQHTTLYLHYCRTGVLFHSTVYAKDQYVTTYHDVKRMPPTRICFVVIHEDSCAITLHRIRVLTNQANPRRQDQSWLTQLNFSYNEANHISKLNSSLQWFIKTTQRRSTALSSSNPTWMSSHPVRSRRLVRRMTWRKLSSTWGSVRCLLLGLSSVLRFRYPVTPPEGFVRSTLCAMTRTPSQMMKKIQLPSHVVIARHCRQIKNQIRSNWEDHRLLSASLSVAPFRLGDLFHQRRVSLGVHQLGTWIHHTESWGSSLMEHCSWVRFAWPSVVADPSGWVLSNALSSRTLLKQIAS